MFKVEYFSPCIIMFASLNLLKIFCKMNTIYQVLSFISVRPWIFFSDFSFYISSLIECLILKDRTIILFVIPQHVTLSTITLRVDVPFYFWILFYLYVSKNDIIIETKFFLYGFKISSKKVNNSIFRDSLI